jgi:hypothetical protein
MNRAKSTRRNLMGARLAITAVMSFGLLGVPSLAMAEHDDHHGHSHSQKTEACTNVQDATCAEAVEATAADHRCAQCQQSAKSLEEVVAKLGHAKQSSDVAQIRAILEEVQMPLVQMKEHMGMCQMQMSKAEGRCPMCKVKLDKDGRCPQCGMKM